MRDDEWQPFLSFADRGSAQAFVALLESADVPTWLRAGALVAGVETNFCLLVPRKLAHRARWVLADSDFSEAELRYLATGELGES